MNDRLYQYSLLMRLDRPIGTFLLLWPTLWALLIAGEGQPDSLVVIVFVIGVILMRSAGCVINDYADRKIDPYVARTQERPIASGKVEPREALILFVGLCSVAFLLVLLMNKLTIMMSLVGVFLAVTYPFMKRYTFLPQPYLGAAFGWAIPMAFAAQTGSVPVVAWLLFIAVILWATAYDTMYAMVDRKDDLRIGVKSTAILFGDADRVIIGLIQLTLLWVLLLVGKQLEFGLYYFSGITVAAALATYQQYLIYHREPEKCFRAFLNNNWFGIAVLGGIVGQYYFP